MSQVNVDGIVIGSSVSQGFTHPQAAGRRVAAAPASRWRHSSSASPRPPGCRRQLLRCATSNRRVWLADVYNTI